MKFVMGIKVELEINEDMDDSLDINELFKNGDIKIGDSEAFLLNEDGDDVMPEEDAKHLAKVFIDGIKEGIAGAL